MKGKILSLWYTFGLVCAIFFLPEFGKASEFKIGISGSGSMDKNNNNNKSESETKQLNDRPIIGILSQEYWPSADENGVANQSYIAASYVKFLEGSGARVVPILINQGDEYLTKIFNSVNGILYPGGSVYFNSSSGYSSDGLKLYKLAEEANNKGDFFPIWGTCLGFEFLLYAASGCKDFRTKCGASNVTDNLKFTKEIVQSRLYGKAPKDIIKYLSTKKTAANFHNYCITPENFDKESGIKDEFRILSLNYDSSSQSTYISSFESIKYPFYGVQFHPEKNIYEFTPKENLPHSFEAILVAQYYANFFVNEARRNYHSFKSIEEETKELIYNYSPIYTGAKGSVFVQAYLFPIINKFINNSQM